MAELLVQSSHWQLLLTALAFVALAGVESLFPLSSDRGLRGRRWFANAALFLIGFGAVFAASPLILKGAAWLQGALHFPPLAGLGMPAWLLVVVSFLLIDLLAYLSHALFHGAPWLWRLHRAHHTDGVVDASTGVRHHPVETLASAALQLTVFAILGVPLLVILAYGLITTLWQFVTHADVRLPEPIDRALRLVVVTPGMHRVHHSVRMDEGNSNFGMVLSVWDRLFGTYRRRPAAERAGMDLGVEGESGAPNLTALLVDPLRP
ncbi:sterol desaturase family protein [Brevundimonas sp.]|uniref:sterol desaturase family protein n=1 Tax=Brevundimonas sp. TaxID=1871086 RepID=UPI00289ACF9A|nr:sterol desaturase family protein [Brevundimonas sp.]